MLREKVEEYLTELKLTGKSHNTIAAYEFHLSKFVAWCEERGVDYTTVNGKETKAFRNYLAQQGLAPRTINAIIAALKSFYDFLVEEEVVKGNPVIPRRLRVIEERRQPDFLSQREVEKVLAALNELPSHINLAFRTMLSTGLRVSEVANLKGEDVLQENGAVFLRVRQGKGKKERIVPVTDPDVGRQLLNLPPQGFGVTTGTLKAYAHEIKKKTGIDFHSHRLRHTFATRLLGQGVPLDVVQKVLGHSNISTTRRYAETLPEAVTKLAAKI